MTEQTIHILDDAINRFNAGDSDALNDIFEASARRFERLAHRMLHGSFERVATREETADIIQETSLRMLRALSDMRNDQECRVKTVPEFLRLTARLMRRALLDLARHHYGKQGSAANKANVQLAGASSAPGVAPIADTSSTPEKLVRWREFHERVETLPVELRDVFDMLWYDEVSQDEAAQALGISVPTVGRRYRDAKLALIEMLGDNLPGQL